MRALGRHQGKDDHVVTAPLHADADAEPSEASTNNQNVRINNVHRIRPLANFTWGHRGLKVSGYISLAHRVSMLVSNLHVGRQG